MKAVSLAALVLAGGKSSRMGQDKAIALWDGTPLLQRVCQVAAECGAPVYVLTPWPDRYQDILNGDYQWLVESQPSQGPLVALAQGLAEIPAEWILLLACDLPLLQTAIIKGWMEQLDSVPAAVLAVVPQQSSLDWEPLCGFYRREALPALLNFIEGGGRSFQIWLDRISVQPLPVGSLEARTLRNCNTPEDLQGQN